MTACRVAHRRAATFTSGCAPSTWLFAIARNTCLDRLRATAPRSFASLDGIIERAGLSGTSGGAAGDGRAALVTRDRPGDHPADPVVETEWRWYVEAVREGCLLATLGCLSVDQRAAFVLRALPTVASGAQGGT